MNPGKETNEKELPVYLYDYVHAMIVARAYGLEIRLR